MNRRTPVGAEGFTPSRRQSIVHLKRHIAVVIGEKFLHRVRALLQNAARGGVPLSFGQSLNQRGSFRAG